MFRNVLCIYTFPNRSDYLKMRAYIDVFEVTTRLFQLTVLRVPKTQFWTTTLYK